MDFYSFIEIASVMIIRKTKEFQLVILICSQGGAKRFLGILQGGAKTFFGN